MARSLSVFRTLLLATLMGSVVAGCGTTGLTGANRLGSQSLEANATKARKPYAKPIRIPEGYYKTAETKTGKELIKELQKITGKNYVDLGYDHARDVMFQTIDDPDGDDKIRDVYTGLTISNVTGRASAYAQGVDTEHTWPQSMGAKDVAKSDLHHLYPVLGRANSTRNNLSYGDVDRVVRVLPDNAGDGLSSKVGYIGMMGFAGARMVFEPRASHKGNVARSLMYFYTRYARLGVGIGGPKLDNFSLEHDTLLRWHAEDPVDADEQQRNEAIFKVQGNRNPFVDHPEYVAKIGRFLGKGQSPE
jgi:hypothetical protein